MTIGVLTRNETLKTVKRPAAMVTVGLFATITALSLFSTVRQHARHPELGAFALPTAWPDLVHEPSVPAGFFSAILLILLVAGEFSWRTARQNVIDGLSKDQWFGGKLLLYLMLVVTFFLLPIALGGATALGVGGAAGPVVRAGDLRLMGADLLLVAGFSAMGFFAAFLARSAGPAMGVLFFYVAVAEQLARAGLGRLGGAWADATKFLPVNLFTDLIEPARYDPASYQRLVAQLAKMNRPAPVYGDSGVLAAVGVAETLLLLALAYVLYRRRDL